MSSLPLTDRIVVDAADAAELLSISERTLFDLTAPNGPIPCIRLGRGPKGQRRYVVAHLHAWAAAAAGQASPDTEADPSADST